MRTALTSISAGFPQIRLGALGIVGLGIAALTLTMLAGHLFAAVGFVVLIGGIVYLSRLFWPPVFTLAFMYQWLQLCGPYYYWIATGYYVLAPNPSEHLSYLYVGLASIVVFFGALALVVRIASRRHQVTPYNMLPVSGRTLLWTYLLFTAFLGGISEFAWENPGITQAVIALSSGRLIILYLVLFRSLANKQYSLVALVMAIEVGVGMTGMFANFREGLIIFVLVFASQLKSLSTGQVAKLAVFGAVIVFAGLAWTGIKGEYRAQMATGQVSESRIERLFLVGDLTLAWIANGGEEITATGDHLVYRFGEAVRFQAIAFERVPEVIGHTHGEFTAGAVAHIFQPRFFFPNKPQIMSDSDKVRVYAGVHVAGREVGTSIAFGYVAEAYVDWGVPFMFVPIFLGGLFWGYAFVFLNRRIRHADLRVASIVVIFWSILYLYEQSWVIMVGQGVMSLIVLGGAVLLIDRKMVRRTVDPATAR